MSRELKNFILTGNFAEVGLRMNRESVLARLGPPPEWLGKPPVIGRRSVSNWESAEVLFYYSGALGIRFGPDLMVQSIHVVMERLNASEPLFVDVALSPETTMGEFRDFLLENGIPFFEEIDPARPHYILASELCLAYSFAFRPPDRPPGCSRLHMLKRVIDAKILPGFTRRGPEIQKNIESP